jgi:hypothetical protein
MAQSLLLSKCLSSLPSPSACISQTVSAVILSVSLDLYIFCVTAFGCRVIADVQGAVSALGCLVQVFVVARATPCHLAGSCSLSHQAVARQSTGSRVRSRTAVAPQVISSCYETRKCVPRYRGIASRKFPQAEMFPS